MSLAIFFSFYGKILGADLTHAQVKSVPFWNYLFPDSPLFSGMGGDFENKINFIQILQGSVFPAANASSNEPESMFLERESVGQITACMVGFSVFCPKVGCADIYLPDQVLWGFRQPG